MARVRRTTIQPAYISAKESRGTNFDLLPVKIIGELVCFSETAKCVYAYLQFTCTSYRFETVGGTPLLANMRKEVLHLIL